jgi:hypothetical protein
MLDRVDNESQRDMPDRVDNESQRYMLDRVDNESQRYILDRVDNESQRYMPDRVDNESMEIDKGSSKGTRLDSPATVKVRLVDYVIDKDTLGRSLLRKKIDPASKVVIQRIIWKLDFTDPKGSELLCSEMKKAELDLGAAVCGMSRNLAAKLLESPHTVKLTSPVTLLEMADCSIVVPLYEILVHVTGYANDGQRLPIRVIKFSVVEKVDGLILGRDAAGWLQVQPRSVLRIT